MIAGKVLIYIILALLVGLAIGYSVKSTDSGHTDEELQQKYNQALEEYTACATELEATNAIYSEVAEAVTELEEEMGNTTAGLTQCQTELGECRQTLDNLPDGDAELSGKLSECKQEVTLLQDDNMEIRRRMDDTIAKYEPLSIRLLNNWISQLNITDFINGMNGSTILLTDVTFKTVKVKDTPEETKYECGFVESPGTVIPVTLVKGSFTGLVQFRMNDDAQYDDLLYKPFISKVMKERDNMIAIGWTSIFPTRSVLGSVRTFTLTSVSMPLNVDKMGVWNMRFVPSSTWPSYVTEDISSDYSGKVIIDTLPGPLAEAYAKYNTVQGQKCCTQSYQNAAFLCPNSKACE